MLCDACATEVSYWTIVFSLQVLTEYVASANENYISDYSGTNIMKIQGPTYFYLRHTSSTVIPVFLLFLQSAGPSSLSGYAF